MARTRSLPFIALLAALFALSIAAAMPVAEADGKRATAKRAVQKGADGRVGIGSGKALKRANRCSRRANTLRRPAHLERSQRQRLIRKQKKQRLLRAKNCRSRAARRPTGPAQSLYWGAAIGKHLTGEQAPWDMDAVESFEASAGKRLSAIHFFSPFANCASACWYYDFPTNPMQSIRDHGAIPFFSWSSQSIPSNLNQPNFQLRDVISGSHDDYIREFAEDANEWGHPFFMRFNWEMNGKWFSWSEGVNGNQAGEYVAAWRHVHDIFTSVGATNATWVWCPNVDPEGKFQDLASLYPGSDYVDWTCLDGYNWGTQPGAQRTRLDFEDLFGSTYREITESIAPGKPMAIGETAASERSGAKAEWIADMLARLPTEYPLIRALVWFDTYDDGMDWPLETSSSATAAFANGIADPSYRSNEYAELSTSPIPPPS